ncbi:MAG: T9SS C-terminal target domain-containing protein [Bacteroidetes bacterium]|nr:MAG: T9SS C-terminal target domain-containing protein [Bacteroidota bacterium]
MKKLLLLVFLLTLLFPAQKSFGQAGDCPYPVIFLHGWTGSESSFSAVYNNNDFANIWGGLADVFHAVVNAQEGTYIWGSDGIPYTNDDDVLVTFTNETNDLTPGCLYAINLDNYWNENTTTPQIYIHDGGSPTFWASDSNESAIYKQGYALGEMIKKVLAANPGKEKVILVAHSMGGLESREYLQRTDANGNHLWWVDPSSPDGHKVAKLVTTTTPHRGSNTMGNISDFGGHDDEFRDGLPDLTSEAVRDLRYSYGCGFLDLDDCPGNYLFGGDEDDIGTWFYANADVDCDGYENNPNIIGININGQQQGFSEPWHGTYDNPAMPLPTNVRYTWITSDIPIDSGDGVVAWSRQWLYNGSTPMPADAVPFRLSDSLLTDETHLTVNSDIKTVIRGFDEGDFPAFAWNVSPEIQFAGLPQKRSINAPDGPFDTDPDWFVFTMGPVSSGGLDVEFVPNPGLGGQIDFFTTPPGQYTGMNTQGPYSIPFSPGSNSVIFNVSASKLIQGNQYFLRITHQNVSGDSWKTPYHFTLSDAAPLPLNLLSFNAKTNERTIDLFWNTMHEVNVSAFEIERSQNAVEFKNIGQVTAIGNSADIQTYSFTDAAPITGTNYYRLKMVDQDGSFRYSPKVSIEIKPDIENITVFPNPGDEQIFLQLETSNSEDITIMIYNTVGQFVLEQVFPAEPGFNQFSFDITNFSSGLYFMEVRQGRTLEKVKFAVENE